MFIVFKVPISEIYLLINSNTMRFLGIVFLFWIVILASCKKEVGNVIVEGRVINVGTQQPIEGVTVVIENEVSFT
ncbi:MAG: energy-coupling factor transporter transmembrane protein EcfT, partial [Salibacteraceae bacterium]